MKRLYIYLTALIVCLNINAQIELVLKNIQVSKINVHTSKNIIREGDTEGPYVHLNFVFKNNSDSMITLHPKVSQMTVQFKYRNKTYYQSVIPILFMANDTLNILPHDQYEGFVDNSLLLGTAILKKYNYDYRIELIEILPTIKLVYKEKEIIVRSSEILNVDVIADKKYNYKFKE